MLILATSRRQNQGKLLTLEIQILKIRIARIHCSWINVHLICVQFRVTASKHILSFYIKV